MSGGRVSQVALHKPQEGPVFGQESDLVGHALYVPANGYAVLVKA